jgi:DNA-binding response OmpR family regulator
VACLILPVLIADDDPAIRTLLRLIVERAGLDVDVAADGNETLALLERKNYALVLLDLQMPRANGFDVVDRLRMKYPRPVIIVVTALPRSQTVQLDTNVVQAIVRKPFDVAFLADIIAGTARSMADHFPNSSFYGIGLPFET